MHWDTTQFCFALQPIYTNVSTIFVEYLISTFVYIKLSLNMYLNILYKGINSRTEHLHPQCKHEFFKGYY